MESETLIKLTAGSHVSHNQDVPIRFLQSKFVDLLRPEGRSIKLAKGEKFCAIDDSSKLIHIIESGKVKLIAQRAGQPAVVRRPTFGFLSEGVMLGLPCQLEVIAERRSLLFAIPREVLLKLISEQADILESWNKYVLSLLNEYVLRNECVVIRGAEGRLLHYLSKRQADRDSLLVPFRRDLAEALGISPETCTRALTRMTAAGTISVEGRFIQLKVHHG